MYNWSIFITDERQVITVSSYILHFFPWNLMVSKKKIFWEKKTFFSFSEIIFSSSCVNFPFFLVKIAHKNKQMKLQHQYYISFKGHEHQHMKHCISFVNFSTVLHIKIHMYYYHCNKQIKTILGRMSSITCLYIMNLIL